MKSDKHRILVIIIAVVLTIIAIGCLVMIFLKFNELKEKNVSTLETTEVTSTENLETTTQASTTEDVTTTIETTTADDYTKVSEKVTPKENVNLRSKPDTGDDSNIVATVSNGTVIDRTGMNENTGWSRLEYNGQVVYAVTSYLTTDLNYTAATTPADDGLKTKFSECNDTVTAKIEVNLRSIPSVTNPDSKVITSIKNGETVTRTGIAEAEGWSRVEYKGQVLYCVTSYIEIVE